ncbi:MAG: hypothetical protein LiPW39_104 [Parcubacteria group bacterium LiPW_39]|nr:MAG: hypothetical protein LiPW39_104 [Parcubacteria group bacterium LiPW_39]
MFQLKLNCRIFITLAACLFVGAAVFLISSKIAGATGQVIINEIAWMGTAASPSDEWFELYNNTAQEIVLEGWKLTEGEGTVIIVLKGTIAPGAYYLIERTDDTTVSDIAADLKGSWGGSGLLNNPGEKIQLLDNNSNLVDEVNCSAGWFAGKASPDYKTMERINPNLSGNLAENWATNDDSALIGHDSQDNPIKGTPKTKNSVAFLSSLTPTPLSSPSPTPSPSPSGSATPSVSPSTPQPTYQFSQNILLNEFLPYPSKDELEWVELFNGGSLVVDLTGWGLNDSAASRQPFQIANDTKIEPGAYLIVSLSKSFLNNDGDQVKLLWPDGQVVHSVLYQKAKQNFSCSRFDDQWFWTNQPTPGQANKKSSFTPSPPPNQTNAAISPLEEKVAVQESPPPQKINTPAAGAGRSSPTAPSISPSFAPNPKIELTAAAGEPITKNSRLKTFLTLAALMVVAASVALGLIYIRRQSSIKNQGSNK